MNVRSEVRYTETRVSKSRAQRIVEWIARNETDINSMTSGNISFSFTDSTLKVKKENYEIV